jgi:Protein of unknown function DUF262
MSKRALFDDPTIARLQAVIESIREGGLLFPEFQRPFVWSDTQRLRLLDSILKGLPIGSLLVWRTKQVVLQHQSKLGSLELPQPSAGTVQHDYVLDGVQRLTTLYGALTGTTTPLEDDDGQRWPIYFDLERDLEDGDEDRFKIPSLRDEPPAQWLPMAALYEGKLRWDHQQLLERTGRQDLANKIERLDRVFKDYSVAIVPIVTDDLQLATMSFERINSQGTRMGESHMLRALSYRRDFDSSSVLAGITERLAWPDLSLELLVRALKVTQGLDIYVENLAELTKLLENDRSPFERLEHGLVASLSFLGQRCRIVGQAALPYALQLVALTNASSRGVDLSEEGVAARLETWLWATTYTEYFKRKTGDQLKRVFDHVLEICDGSTPLPLDLPRSCAPLKRFNARSVRSLMFMHLLARQPLIDERGAPIDGPRLVARGSSAFAKLFFDEATDDPANRVLVDPLDAASLRAALGDRAHPRSEALREAHLLPPWNHPAAELPRDILSWRRERLAQLQAADLARLGLHMDPG